jgi:inosine/guanosine/xanthosine phosphorylase family protein
MTMESLAAARHAANEIDQIADGFRPDALVVLGSGLGAVVDGMAVVAEMPFGALPGFAPSAVVGHAGRFVFGHIGTVAVMAMMGRLHLYEGHPVDRIVLPVRAAHLLGCRTLIATNAAGGIAADLRVGQTMLITDHINLLGTNPLTGPNIDEFGPRFPAMADAYDARLRTLAHAAAGEAGVDLAEGVYAAVPGPNYETAAEIRYLRAIGADAVGMSTVPEVIAARHVGMQVAGLSLVANVAGEMTDSHEHVLATVEAGADDMARVVAGILARL